MAVNIGIIEVLPPNPILPFTDDAKTDDLELGQYCAGDIKLRVFCIMTGVNEIMVSIFYTTFFCITQTFFHKLKNIFVLCSAQLTPVYFLNLVVLLSDTYNIIQFPGPRFPSISMKDLIILIKLIMQDELFLKKDEIMISTLKDSILQNTSMISEPGLNRLFLILN